MNRSGIAPLALLATIALASCETTQQKSAQIAKRDANQTADAQQTKIGAASKTVKVDQAQLVHTSSGTAAAIQLTNLSGQAQAHIPIIVTAYDAAGKAVYSNNTVGADLPSGELTLLGAHATVWWVDSNVLAGAGTPVRVSAQIGAGKTPASTPALSVSRLSSGSNFVGAFISGRAVNGSNQRSHRSRSTPLRWTAHASRPRPGHLAVNRRRLLGGLSSHRDRQHEGRKGHGDRSTKQRVLNSSAHAAPLPLFRGWRLALVCVCAVAAGAIVMTGS